MDKRIIDDLDRKIITALQGGFPVKDDPFGEVAAWFDTDRNNIIKRISALLDNGALSQFGPLYNTEKMGDTVTLAALQVPSDRYDEVTALVNAHREVVHNYTRTHKLNMWFVLSTQTPYQITKVIETIENETGLHVYNYPKQQEYFIGVRSEI